MRGVYAWECANCPHLCSDHRGNTIDPYRCLYCECERPTHLDGGDIPLSRRQYDALHRGRPYKSVSEETP